MRVFACALALIATSLAFAKNHVVEAIDDDIDGDGKADRIVLSLTTEPNEPGEFNQIDLTLTASGRHFSLKNDDLWIRFDGPNPGLSPRRPIKNLLKSQRLILHKMAEADYLLIAIGQAYASEPQKLTAIRISRTGARLVLNEEMDLKEIGDIDDDGRTDIVGAMVSESLGSGCHSYNPDVVYTLHDTFRLNHRLTEKYDRAQDGFYAADNGRYIVLEHSNGKKQLLRENEPNRCDK
jgi:hypothetical protein